MHTRVQPRPSAAPHLRRRFPHLGGFTGPRPSGRLVALAAVGTLSAAACTAAPPDAERAATTSAAETVWDRSAGSSGIIDNPTVVNVYWDTSGGAWDAAAGAAGSHAQLDWLTMALVKSAYFQGAQQYGVNTWTWGGGIVLGDVCPTSASNVAVPPATTTVGHNLIHNSIPSCLLNALEARGPSGELIVNYFYPPGVPDGGDVGCAPSGSNAAYHDISGGLASTWLPLAHDCTGDSLFGVFASMSHEMVESATDPNHTGVMSTGLHDGLFQEIGDLCEGPPNGLLTSQGFTPFFNPLFATSVEDYFEYSNVNNGCGAGMANSSTPQIKVTALGRGKNMTFNVAYTSQNNLMDPPDLTNTGTVASTMYLNALIRSSGSGTVNVGRTLLGDTVSFGSITYQDDTTQCAGGAVPTATPFCDGIAVAKGFTQDVAMSAGDSITFTMFDPYNGLAATDTVAAPAPHSVDQAVFHPLGTPVSGWTIFGDESVVSGFVADAQCQADALTPPQFPIEGEAVSESVVDTSGGTRTLTATSDENGNFTMPFQVATAGLATMNLEAPLGWVSDGCSTAATSVKVTVHPQATSLSPDSSSVVNTTVTLHGAGFTPNAPSRTTVTVAGTKVPVLSIAADGTSLTFNAGLGAAGHTVQVIASVDGVPSVPLSFLYAEPPPPPTCDGVKKPISGCSLPESWICCSTWKCAKYCSP